jgi:hypothetical protein
MSYAPARGPTLGDENANKLGLVAAEPLAVES